MPDNGRPPPLSCSRKLLFPELAPPFAGARPPAAASSRNHSSRRLVRRITTLTGVLDRNPALSAPFTEFFPVSSSLPIEDSPGRQFAGHYISLSCNFKWI
ncbi:hypothetical protein KSP40_PGU007888 [Platanthera guangdongensis]|uniref:Uncharacterized protein n=1 Tax=Platanthera guangdongensis TaxID=2320717 RepID=A0ABR2N008_9ASPA